MGKYSNFKSLEQIYFLRSYENRELLANLKTDSNKNLARSHFFNISLNTNNFRRTPTPHKIFSDLFHLLLKFRFTASETELDHYHYKLDVRGTLQFVKQPRK